MSEETAILLGRCQQRELTLIEENKRLRAEIYSFNTTPILVLPEGMKKVKDVISELLMLRKAFDLLRRIVIDKDNTAREEAKEMLKK